MFERRLPPKPKEGCKIKIKRDNRGNIVEYTSNGKCSPAEIQQFKESTNHPENGLDDEY